MKQLEKMSKRIQACSNALGIPNDSRILSLSPFPPDGEWGGAIRSREMFKVIKEIFPKSEQVYCYKFPVYHLDFPECLLQPHGQLDDIRMLYKIFYTENHIDYIPDAIIFDHPWLWTEAKRLKEKYPETKIIHASHNLEWKVKQSLLADLSDPWKTQAIDIVRNAEEEIAKEADLIVAIKKDEADWFIANGAENVIVANNGTNSFPQEIESQKTYALVVGSGHPPNVEGSIKYLKDATEWLPEGTDLIFVGSMCDSLHGMLGEERNNDRDTTIRFLGKRSNDELDKLIKSANVILLPIPYGGGSNLKTAEALCSGRPIVGTEISFRGFESFKTSTNTSIADEIEEFRFSVSWYCRSKYKTVSRNGYESLLWNSTLDPFRKYLSGE